jgi:hypothetical protein
VERDFFGLGERRTNRNDEFADECLSFHPDGYGMISGARDANCEHKQGRGDDSLSSIKRISRCREHWPVAAVIRSYAHERRLLRLFLRVNKGAILRALICAMLLTMGAARRAMAQETPTLTPSGIALAYTPQIGYQGFDDTLATVQYPTGCCSAGQVAYVAIMSGSSYTPGTWPTVSNFTHIGTTFGDYYGWQLDLYRRVLTGSEGSSETATTTDPNGINIWVMRVYSNVSTSQPEDSVSAWANPSTAMCDSSANCAANPQPVVPSMTTVTNGDMLMDVCLGPGNVNPLTQPSGFGNPASLLNPSDPEVVIMSSDMPQSSAGVTGSVGCTGMGGGNSPAWDAILVAMKPSAPVTPGVATNAQCAFLEDDCATIDTSNVITRASISVNAAGIWTASCTGTTTHVPKKATICNGETLNKGTEAAPTVPCNLETFGSGGNKGPKAVDDWVETISTAGNVKLTCKFNPKETGK